MKDSLLQQLQELNQDPIPLLNLPEDERMQFETALFDLAELLEDYRCGVIVHATEAEASEYASGQPAAE